MALQRFVDQEVSHLQTCLVYAIIVAGKSAMFASQVIIRLFHSDSLPFDQVREWIHERRLLQKLKRARTGNYTKLSKALRQLVAIPDLDLRHISVSDLEAVHGIGPKTARFFVLWTRPGAQCAALDVHVLRWLRAQGYDAPRQTPTSRKRYDELESIFLTEAAIRSLTPGEFDRKIWEA